MLALLHQSVDCEFAVLVEKWKTFFVAVEGRVLLQEPVVDAVRLEGSRVVLVGFYFVDGREGCLVLSHLGMGNLGASILFSVWPGDVFRLPFADRVLLPSQSSFLDIEVLFEIREGEIAVGCTRHAIILKLI